ncbi:uncharacterized protein [Rutidosis leptorrhynchoides]|uniref:uncharacterized protein n=1 Tax=Rutidosis leptorrhynchoides TaxID=125765 RepID=UPI003A9906D2
MSITKCLASHENTFTTYNNFHANKAPKIHANPFSNIPMHPFSITRGRWNLMIVYADQKQDAVPPPPASHPPSSTWKNWIIGFLMTFIVPFFTTKGGPIKAFLIKVDNILDSAEQISEVVEVVADKVDKVAEKLSDDMEEGSKIKKTLDFIEQVAEKLEKDAHTAGDFIDKVQEMQDKIEDLMEPVLSEAKEVEKEVKHKK